MGKWVSFLRMYYRDGEKIVDLVKTLPEEKKEKVKLARTFEEARSGKYPYEKVLLGDI